MRKIKVIKFDGKELTVKELNVKEISVLVDGMDDEETCSVLDLLMDNGVSTAAVCVATGLSRDDLEKGDFSPSELSPLYEEVAAINPSYTSMLKKMETLTETLGRSLAALPAS